MNTILQDLQELTTKFIAIANLENPAETYHCAECDFETTSKQRAEQHKEGECLKGYE